MSSTFLNPYLFTALRWSVIIIIIKQDLMKAGWLAPIYCLIIISTDMFNLSFQIGLATVNRARSYRDTLT
jgi:hypothetical protein